MQINFKEEKGKQVLISKNKVADVAPSFYLLEAKQQYNYLLTHDNIGLTEGTLVERSVYYDVTMYDEKYSLIEDMPFWLNVTKAGIKYHYVDEPTMLYRIHESVVHAGNGRILNKNFVDIKRQVINDMVKPYIPWYNVKCQVRFFIDDLIYFSVFNLFNNSPSFLSKIVLSFFYRIRP